MRRVCILVLGVVIAFACVRRDTGVATAFDFVSNLGDYHIEKCHFQSESCRNVGVTTCTIRGTPGSEFDGRKVRCRGVGDNGPTCKLVIHITKPAQGLTT
jgi:hypothetical protein